MPGLTTLVIFGASGDLTRRKLIPALYHLYRKGRLPENFALLGVARHPIGEEAYRDSMREAVAEFSKPPEPASWAEFRERLHYMAADPTQTQGLRSVEARLRRLESEFGEPAQRLYYFAIPPEIYQPILECLAEAGMTQEDRGWRRVVIEKPFGRDLDTARALNQAVHDVLREDQVYRIDHYLGKETVQNVLVFRFANSIFEPLWNRNYIDHVQITVAESVGVAHRAAFYDSVGVLRDVFQNHLLQLLALVGMEPPSSFDPEMVRNERTKVLSAVRRMSEAEVGENTVRGQYRGFEGEPGVKPGSQTATYGALRLFIDNWRWQDVPFYLRSGKQLTEKTTEILIQFKSVPHQLFPLSSGREIRPNALFLCIQPDEGMHLRFEVKVPDTEADLRSVDMDFHYADDFGPGALPDAYERLLLDALEGDASLYTRADAIELAWQIVDPIVRSWEVAGSPRLEMYAPGSWGPAASETLLRREGREWSLGCGGGETDEAKAKGDRS